MAKLSFHFIGKLAESSSEGKIISEYLKRISWPVTIRQLDIKEKFPSDKQKIFEGIELLKSIPESNYIIALDETGDQYASRDFAMKLQKIEQPISFIIGGAFGLSDEIRIKANMILALGKMTMPHMIARLVLIEQIYRAYSIINNHPYHK